MSQPNRLPTQKPVDVPAEAATVDLPAGRAACGARAGFVGAFARTVRSGHAGSPVGGIAVGALVVVLVAGVVVAVGALLNRPAKAARPTAGPGAQSSSVAVIVAPPAGATVDSGQRPSAGSGGNAAQRPAPPVASTAKPITYQAVAGLGCSRSGTSYKDYGWFVNGDAGWWTVATGSWIGDGCDGRFHDMPMSGSATGDNLSQAIMWGFNVGTAGQTCALWLYVPNSSSVRDVAATAAHFVVLRGTAIDSKVYATPPGDQVIDQRDHRGQWLPLGEYPVTNGTIGILLTNRGDPNGYPETFPHLAGGAVKANCVAM